MKSKRMIAICSIAVAFTLCLSGCNTKTIQTSSFADAEAPQSVLMFAGSDENIDVGTLYFQTYGFEEEKIAEDVKKDRYKLMPNSKAILFLDVNDTLWYKPQEGDKIKISEDVCEYSFKFSEDESTIGFMKREDDNVQGLCGLYINKIGADREKIASNLSTMNSDYTMSKDGSAIFWKDSENAFYKKTLESDKEKIDSDVDSFTVNKDGTAYTYATYTNNGSTNRYIKWANATEPEKITSEYVGGITLCENGMMAVFINEFNWEKVVGELCAIIQGGEPIKIASDVCDFRLSHSGDKLYYRNDENTVYFKQLPTVTENSYQKQADFQSALNQTEKISLCSEVTEYDISPDGESCVFINSDDTLYISCKQQEKVRVASDVEQVSLFPEMLLFQTIDKDLVLNRFVVSENIHEHNEKISQNVLNYSTSTYGKYLIFTTDEEDYAYLYVDGQKNEPFLTNVSKYDAVSYNGMPVYLKLLKLTDLVGIYKNDELGRTYKISADGQMEIYEKGVLYEQGKLNIFGINKRTATVYFEESEFQGTFDVDASGMKSIELGGTSYTLTEISEEEFNTELERQRQAEIDRKKSAARQRGENYKRNGINVSNTQKVYFSPNYNDITTYSYAYTGNKSVYDYYVSEDGTELWLKVRMTMNETGNTEEYWVPETE